MQDALGRALDAARRELGRGRVASYIPELARADPNVLALAVHPLDGEPLAVGDAERAFSLQSISKVFALAAVLSRGRAQPLERMSVEPSGDAFHSMVRLEEERGRPRNPLINAGAIVVSSELDGDDADAKLADLQAFLARAGVPGTRIDQAVYHSERDTGHRNRALAHYMRHFGVLQGDPDVAVDTYFRQCSLEVTTAQLARAALFLANGGVDPPSQQRLVSAADNRLLLALMTTCGLYDEVGRFAVRVGLPAKSGVSGAILAVVPGRMTLVGYSPELGPKGNSLAAMAALEVLADALGLSVFA